jgi:predicted glycoside hydrolase/deacetylase ChbG (UPF0249 family)
MKRLIVNADDLGRTPGINAGVFRAHREGIVTSATVMVAYPAAAEAARLARENPDLGLGLHVQLSGGAPLLGPAQVPSLVGVDGRFPAKPEGHAAPREEEALAEARAQFARFVELFGRKPTHLDSHHHSHRLEPVFRAITALAREHGLPVRNSGGDMGERLAAAGVRRNDHFVERFFDHGATLANLEAIVAALGEGTTELMCHPAVVDDELRGSSGYAAPRERELAVLTDPAARQAVERAGVTLVHFGQP